MKTFKTLCLETISSKVYHYTDIHKAAKILADNKFAFAVSSGTDSETEKGIKGHPYYLSLTRSKVGDYTIHQTYQHGVVFNLNGDYFNQRHKGKPIDYWDSWWIKQNEVGHKDRSREMEDRVYSKNMFMDLPKEPTKLIDSIHILSVPPKEKDKTDRRQINTNQNVRSIMIWAKTHKVPVFLYTDKKSFLLQKNPQPITPEYVQDQLKGNIKLGDSWGSMKRDYLKRYRELWFKEKVSQLSPEARKLLGRLYSSETATSMASDIHNSKQGGNRSVEKMLNVFRWAKVSTPKEYIEKMYNKWMTDDAKWRRDASYGGW